MAGVWSREWFSSAGEKGDWLLKYVEGRVAKAIKGDLAGLASRVRGEGLCADSTEVGERLVYFECLKSGAAGGLTALTGLLPVPGSFLAIGAGTLLDAGALLNSWCDAVMAVGAAHGFPPDKNKSPTDILSVLGSRLGVASSPGEMARRLGEERLADAAMTQLLNMLAVNLASVVLAHKGRLKAIPVLGMVSGTWFNVRSTREVGRIADDYFREKGARTSA